MGSRGPTINPERNIACVRGKASATSCSQAAFSSLYPSGLRGSSPLSQLASTAHPSCSPEERSG